jgi:hypothetical protein
MQVVPSELVPPRERTPKATHRPASKLDCSNAPDPESPSHVLSPDMNSVAVRYIGACEGLDAKQSRVDSLGFGSFGMHASATFCRILRVPAVEPEVSVGLSTP